MPDAPRSREARALAEAALVRLAHAYGDTPEFVLLGGLLPDLLCSNADRRHVGTTDVDVQINLEIQGDSRKAPRLERALRESGFTPSDQYVWRWTDNSVARSVVKIEFLADVDTEPSQATVTFTDCEALGAVNLRGTGFAARDWEIRHFLAETPEGVIRADVRVATLPAFLLTKAHAAHGRAAAKDWYDIAYVLLHNDQGGPAQAADRALVVFGDDLVGATATALGELQANFSDADAQGSSEYARQMNANYPETDVDVLAQDAVAAVTGFIELLKLP